MEAEVLSSNLRSDTLLPLLYTVGHMINSGTQWGRRQGGGVPPAAG